ncbi:MAG: dTDP-4-dehydrorhamnose 3,5-epimerase [Thermincolia bacterium]
MYKLIPSRIEGCFEILPYVFSDARGRNMKFYHNDTFRELGLECNYNEDLIVLSQKNVIRGIHLQNHPYPQTKLVCCAQGEIFDVLVDLRKNSPTYGKHEAFNLSGEKLNMLYIPHGIGHGYCAISETALVCYKIAGRYNVDHETGIKWDSVGIPWPVKEPVISQKDRELTALDNYTSRF